MISVMSTTSTYIMLLDRIKRLFSALFLDLLVQLLSVRKEVIFLMNGQQEEALVDTGSFQTVVSSILVPSEQGTDDRASTSCVCAHCMYPMET